MLTLHQKHHRKANFWLAAYELNVIRVGIMSLNELTQKHEIDLLIFAITVSIFESIKTPSSCTVTETAGSIFNLP